MRMMGEKGEVRRPVKTLHEFLFEISKAWDSYRTGSLINIVVSVILALLLVPRFISYIPRKGEFVDTLITGGVILGLCYNAYLNWKQHEFYKKWEKRLGLLMQTEESLLGTDEENPKK
jgi:hypothetical protein